MRTRFITYYIDCVLFLSLCISNIHVLKIYISLRVGHFTKTEQIYHRFFITYSLFSLNFFHNFVGAVALAEVIADTPRIVRLDLQENDIKTAGLMALSLALKVNKSLSRLDLDKDTKKEQVCKVILSIFLSSK